MRHALFLAFLFVFIAAPAVHAQDAAATDSKVKTSSDRVQLVEDDKNGVIRFVIDGKEVARLDASGLHVDGKVTSDNSVVLPVIHEPAMAPVKPAKGAP